MNTIVDINAALVSSGAVDAWFAGCDDQVRAVASGVNGPLLIKLAARVGYHDTE